MLKLHIFPFMAICLFIGTIVFLINLKNDNSKQLDNTKSSQYNSISENDKEGSNEYKKEYTYQDINMLHESTGEPPITTKYNQYVYSKSYLNKEDNSESKYEEYSYDNYNDDSYHNEAKVPKPEPEFDTSEIEAYLLKETYLTKLVSYNNNTKTIRFRSAYPKIAIEVHLPRAIMAYVKGIEELGYPIDNLEVEIYVMESRFNHSDESVLLYKNSNLDNINVYVDESGRVISKSFYKGSQIEILNNELFEDNLDLIQLYDYYLENK